MQLVFTISVVYLFKTVLYLALMSLFAFLNIFIFFFLVEHKWLSYNFNRLPFATDLTDTSTFFTDASTFYLSFFSKVFLVFKLGFTNVYSFLLNINLSNFDFDLSNLEFSFFFYVLLEFFKYILYLLKLALITIVIPFSTCITIFLPNIKLPDAFNTTNVELFFFCYSLFWMCFIMFSFFIYKDDPVGNFIKELTFKKKLNYFFLVVLFIYVSLFITFFMYYLSSFFNSHIWKECTFSLTAFTDYLDLYFKNITETLNSSFAKDFNLRKVRRNYNMYKKMYTPKAMVILLVTFYFIMFFIGWVYFVFSKLPYLQAKKFKLHGFKYSRPNLDQNAIALINRRALFWSIGLPCAFSYLLFLVSVYHGKNAPELYAYLLTYFRCIQFIYCSFTMLLYKLLLLKVWFFDVTLTYLILFVITINIIFFISYTSTLSIFFYFRLISKTGFFFYFYDGTPDIVDFDKIQHVNLLAFNKWEIEYKTFELRNDVAFSEFVRFKKFAQLDGYVLNLYEAKALVQEEKNAFLSLEIPFFQFSQLTPERMHAIRSQGLFKYKEQYVSFCLWVHSNNLPVRRIPYFFFEYWILYPEDMKNLKYWLSNPYEGRPNKIYAPISRIDSNFFIPINF